MQSAGVALTLRTDGTLDDKRDAAMVASIEDQVHQFLVREEEDRCRAIEVENDRNDGTRGKSIKRRVIVKPWSRPTPLALCQHPDLLVMVTEYDYDLSDDDFCAYCTARGVLHVAGQPGTTRWTFLSDYTKPKSAYLSDPYFQHGEEVDGKRHRYSDTEMETGWKIILLERAHLQDCWELYSRASGRQAVTVHGLALTPAPPDRPGAATKGAERA
jgi:hypothetical protein